MNQAQQVQPPVQKPKSVGGLKWFLVILIIVILGGGIFFFLIPIKECRLLKYEGGRGAPTGSSVEYITIYQFLTKGCRV